MDKYEEEAQGGSGGVEIPIVEEGYEGAQEEAFREREMGPIDFREAQLAIAC